MTDEFRIDVNVFKQCCAALLTLVRDPESEFSKEFIETAKDLTMTFLSEEGLFKKATKKTSDGGKSAVGVVVNDNDKTITESVEESVETMDTATDDTVVDDNNDGCDKPTKSKAKKSKRVAKKQKLVIDTHHGLDDDGDGDDVTADQLSKHDESLPNMDDVENTDVIIDTPEMTNADEQTHQALGDDEVDMDTVPTDTTAAGVVSRSPRTLPRKRPLPKKKTASVDIVGVDGSVKKSPVKRFKKTPSRDDDDDDVSDDVGDDDGGEDESEPNEESSPATASVTARSKKPTTRGRKSSSR